VHLLHNGQVWHANHWQPHNSPTNPNSLSSFTFSDQTTKTSKKNSWISQEHEQFENLQKLLNQTNPKIPIHKSHINTTGFSAPPYNTKFLTEIAQVTQRTSSSCQHRPIHTTEPFQAHFSNIASDYWWSREGLETGFKEEEVVASSNITGHSLPKQ